MVAEVNTPGAEDSAPKKAKMGRPTDYDPAMIENVRTLALNGATDKEIAEYLRISVGTLYNYSNRYAEFMLALKVGKEAADDRVVRNLYSRATGYTFDSQKIFQFQGAPVIVPCVEHVPPDITAAIFWLKNRRPKEWRDRTEQDVTHTHQLSDSVQSLLAGIRGDRQDIPEAEIVQPLPIASPEQPGEIRPAGGF